MRRMTAATATMVVLALVACGKDKEAPTTQPSATAAPTPTPTPVPTPSAPPEVETSPEMKSFMSMLDGTPKGAANALQKYGSKTTQKNDLGMYTLKDPKVVKSEKLGVMQCYTMESMAGVMKHTTKVCWDSTNKISQITDKAE